MTQLLTTSGRELPEKITADMLASLGIGPETPVVVEWDGTSLHIRPARDEQRAQRVSEALDDVNDDHGETLRRLAQ